MSLKIAAPIERVYALASDPEIVPSYAPEVARIEVMQSLSEHLVLGRSYLKIARLTFGFLYRYHYRPPFHYSGVQEGRGLLRGYFTLSFMPCAGETIVHHIEGMFSPVPLLALISLHLLPLHHTGGGMEEELGRLKELVESRTA